MKKGFAKQILLIVPFMFIGLAALAAITLKPYAVANDFMSPTFKNGQKIFINKLAYANSNPKRGDIIVVGVDNKTSSIKPTIRRVVGLPGETVEIKKGYVYINSQPLDEPYLDKNANYDFEQETTRLDSSHFFVLPDNRKTNLFRGTDVAPISWVPKNFIIGKYFLSY